MLKENAWKKKMKKKFKRCAPASSFFFIFFEIH